MTLSGSTKRSAFRFIGRCCALAVAVVFALQVLPWAWAAMVLPAMSPFVMLCSVIAARSAGLAALAGLPALVVAALSRRWFCRYLCPMGLLAELVGRLRASTGGNGIKLPPVGQWIALVTLGGAFLGYPLLLWMDPLALFNGFFGMFRTPLGLAAVLSGIGLPIVLLISLLRRNLWCGRICPLGVTQDLLSLPRQMLRSEKSPETQNMSGEGGMARRSILAMGAGAVWAGMTLRISRAARATVLRPPGSADEKRFAGLCVRCGNCIRACPTKIIRPDIGGSGIAGLLTPVIHFDENYCLDDCRRCTEVCPSGAIARLSLERKRKTPIGLAAVDMAYCLLSEEKECTICANQCSVEAIEIVFDEKEYSSTPRIDAGKCNGCGACQTACPTSPKAIRVSPLRA